MKVEGEQKIEAPRERVFAALIDPAVLHRCIPGCQELEKTGDSQYAAKLTASVGSIKGVFTATVTMAELVAPSHYKLLVDAKGQQGFAKGSGILDLGEQNRVTELKYTGDVNVGGTLASVGQRMLESTARMMVAKFFSALANETYH
jgi:carbon monoxide dehydrogenase subunit G